MIKKLKGYISDKVLVCPTCEENGTLEVLGEFDNEGGLCVLRFRNSTTKIYAREFVIRCGVCDTIVCKRHDNQFKTL